MSNAVIVQPLPIVAATASSSAAGYLPEYVGNDHAGVVWKSGVGQASQSITIDLGADMAVDAALLLGCTGASAAWTLTIQAATAAQGAGFPGGSWSSGAMPFLAGSAMPVSGKGRTLWLGTGSPPATARYWRFTVSGLSNAALSIARIVLGRKIQLARNFQFGAAFGIRDTGSADFSIRGVLGRRRGVKMRSVGVSFGSVHKDEVEAVVHPLIEQVGITEPIALITDPDAHAQRQNRIWFGTITGDVGTVWQKPDGFEWRVSLVGLLL